ncbi:hypothetical protein RSSM_06078 [Rhodopirellula sallentina SM41]|uniref:Uncharacterized protein n=1 Tax=Rhodopirellula sallentina SM41 TaxID=1263870 RepID=M5U968_9BACT|nr:hypothetical protein RSSM_06078 [Rhodopirellula sallentina SM41]
MFSSERMTFRENEAIHGGFVNVFCFDEEPKRRIGGSGEILAWCDFSNTDAAECRQFLA